MSGAGGPPMALRLERFQDLPIIRVEYEPQQHRFLVKVMHLWREEIILVDMRSLPQDIYGMLHEVARKEQRLEFENPSFTDRHVNMRVHYGSSNAVWVESFEIEDPQENLMALSAKLVRGGFADETIERSNPKRTRRLYYWQKECKNPESHGFVEYDVRGKQNILTCGCKHFDDYELPVEAQIDDWVEKIG